MSSAQRVAQEAGARGVARGGARGVDAPRAREGDERAAPRRRRPRFSLRWRLFLLALLVLPEVVFLLDLVFPRLGVVPTLCILAVLQIPTWVELRRVGADRPAGLGELVGWQTYYAFWSGAMIYAVGAGWLRLAWWAASGDLGAAGAALPAWAVALPFLVAAWGVFVGQHRYPRRVVKVEMADLGRGWEGARVVQLSDLHVGRFIGAPRLERLARKARRLQPDLVVITGDIVDTSSAFAPLAARVLATIDAPLGVWAVLGNHDHYAGAGAVRTALEAAGIRVLVNAGTLLCRDGHPLWLAGVDDLWHGADLEAALAARPPEVPVLLLSHQPNLFPAAARRGVALTLSGHTHGGQVAVPFVRSLSLARTVSRFTAGAYASGRSRLYVSRGAGVIRPLLRVGAPPEVAALDLAASPRPSVAGSSLG